MLTFFEVRIGTDTAPACALCASSAQAAERSPVPLEQIAAELLRVARGWAHGPGPNVTFTGFEPFAHPELPDIIGAARSAGFVRVRLRTDAGALATGVNARGAIEAGVRQLDVVGLGPDDVHDRLSGHPGLAAASAAGLAAFHAAAEGVRVPVAVTGFVPVCRHNVQFAPGAVARLAALGAVAVHLDGSRCPRQHMPFVTAALDTAAVNGVAGWVSALEGEAFPAPWRVAPIVVEEASS